MNLRDFFLVATGGAAGAVARYATGMFFTGIFGERFPWSTLVVNVLGCFLLGFLLHPALLSSTISDATKLTLGTGFLGAFTTFSTFGVQTAQLWERSPISAVGNVAANVAIGIAAAIAGAFVAAYFLSAE